MRERHTKLFRRMPRLTRNSWSAELAAEKGDERLASSGDSACARRMERERVREHDVRRGESVGSEPPTRVPPAGTPGHVKRQGPESERRGATVLERHSCGAS